MLDLHTEFNNYSQRRMREEFKEMHAIAVRWGDEKRQLCAPAQPQSINGKIIDQTPLGASQVGAPTPPAERDVEVIGICVAKLRAIEAAVFEAEYAWCFGWEIARKLRWLFRERKIRISKSQYKHKLMVSRERVSMAYEIIY